MPQMQTTYGGGQSTTATRGLGGGSAAMMFDPSALGGLLQKRLRERDEDRAWELEQRGLARQELHRAAAAPAASSAPRAASAAAGGARGGALRLPEIGEKPVQTPEGRGVDARMEALEMGARIKQLEALTGPAPTRLVQGAGIVTGRTLDPLAMNAFQRQAYLPQGSATTLPPSERGIGEELEEFDEQNLLREARARALERMRAGDGPVRVTGWGSNEYRR